MHVEERGLVYDAAGRPPDQRVACFTSLCPTAAGDWLCGFQVGPSKHAATATVRLCRSRDAGRTWGELPARFETARGGVPGSLAAIELTEAEPGRLLAFATWFDRSDPARPLFDPATEGILRSKQLCAASADGGTTWGPWAELATGDLTGCATTGPPVRWPGGTIAYAFESFKEYDDPRPGRHAAWVLVSHDGGRHFGPPRLIAQHPEHEVYYWDQRLCPGPAEGRYVALFWTHDLKRQKDLTVHLRHGSIDAAGGPITDTGIPGQIAAPLLLPDGRLLAFVVYRGRPGTLTLWASPDGGRSWPADDRLVVYTHDERAALSQGLEGIDFKQYWEDMGKWTFGHPAIRPLDGDRVLLAYYAGTPGCTSVHWARVHVGRPEPIPSPPVGEG